MNQDRFVNRFEGRSLQATALEQLEAWVAYGHRLNRKDFLGDWFGHRCDGTDFLDAPGSRPSVSAQFDVFVEIDICSTVTGLSQRAVQTNQKRTLT